MRFEVKRYKKWVREIVETYMKVIVKQYVIKPVIVSKSLSILMGECDQINLHRNDRMYPQDNKSWDRSRGGVDSLLAIREKHTGYLDAETSSVAKSLKACSRNCMHASNLWLEESTRRTVTSRNRPVDGVRKPTPPTIRGPRVSWIPCRSTAPSATKQIKTNGNKRR